MSTKTSRSRRHLLRLTALATVSVLVAACGSSGNDSSSAESPSTTAADATTGSTTAEVTNLTIGFTPVPSAAPAYIAEKAGLFADHHLAVKIEPVQGGADSLPLVIRGDMQFSYTNVISVIQASDSGLPICVVTAGDMNRADTHSIYVLKDSPIQEAKDLEGKKVAINNLRNIGHLGMVLAIEAGGGDSSKVNFVELPFPNMAQALEQGAIDAAMLPEPFATEAQETLGARRAVPMFTGEYEDFPNGVYVTSRDYAEANPGVVKDFAAAVEGGMKLANDEPQQVIDVVPTFTRVAADMAAKIGLPHFMVPLDVDRLQFAADTMSKFDFLDGDFDMSGLICGS